MKKYLDLILLGVAAFFSLLMFVFMALPAFVLKSGNLTIKSESLYECMGDSALIVVAFILGILVFLAAACLCALLVLKKLDKVPAPHFIAIGVGVLALVAAILFFIVPSNLTDESQYARIGAGSLLSGLFLLFAAFAACGFGALKLLKK